MSAATASVWHPRRVFITVISMLGLRLDRSPAQAACMFAIIIITATLAFFATDMQLGNVLGTSTHKPHMGASLGYLIGVWAMYYVGHATVYKLNLHRLLREKFGQQRAYTMYTTWLGVVYFHVIWSQLPFLAAYQGTLQFSVSPTLVAVASLTLFCLSFGLKIWATLHLGVGGYYYEDMFLEERAKGGPMVNGPYALFSDPMYSVGYFPIYGSALFAQSMEGLIAAIIFHVSIYIFNIFVERPFVLRMYGNG